MPAPRISENELQTILKRRGYGLKSEIGKSSLESEVGRPREVRNVEPDSGYESLRAQAVARNDTGKCNVRIKFFRKRLADYSRANCEKYIIDSLTYAGIIRDDSEKEIRLIDEGQEKVMTAQEERVEIILEYENVDLENLWVHRDRLGNIGGSSGKENGGA